MFQKLRNSWELAKASAEILFRDKELLLFPLLSGLALLLVSASFLVPSFLTGAHSAGALGVFGAVVLFFFYVCQYFVIVFFNAALVGAAMKRLDGEDPTVADGLGIAWSRVGTILGYATIAATVGVLLKMMQRRSGTVGRFIVGLVGVGWSLATFLVVPVLVAERVGPIDTVKRSAAILKRTWGEQIAGNVGLGALFALMWLGLAGVAIPVLAGAAGVGEPAVMIAAGIVVGVLALLLLLFSSALKAVYTAVLYRFATTGDAGVGFDAGTLRGAFNTR
jgi:hypothetical protein